MRIKYLIVACLVALLPTYTWAEVSQAEFEKAMEQYLKTPKGQETLGQAVEGYFRKRQEEARKKQEQRAAAQMEEQFKNPVKIPIGNSPVKGPKNAKVTIVEFSDFQCPYCARGRITIEQVLKAYPNEVKVVFKNLPLPFHKNAMGAAKAALAAAKQGKFWEMHDELFKNQRNLSQDFYIKTAQKLGLNVEKFKKDMNSPEIKKQIDEDMALARKHGIRGTPGFFVGGVAVKGAYPFEHFKKIIDRWLEKGGAPTQKS